VNHIKVDLHVHSKYSKDSSGSVEEIIDSAIERGLNAIAITDHDTMEGNKEAQEICDGKKLTIIPGIEITTKDGHLLVLNISEKIPSQLSLLETIKRARDKNGFIIAPHLFHRYRHGIGGKIKKDEIEVDAIEVYNSRYITGIANKRAKWYAKKNSIPIVAGSDSHIPEMVGYGVTKINTENSVENILREIKKSNTDIELDRTPISLFLKQAVISAWKHFLE